MPPPSWSVCIPVSWLQGPLLGAGGLSPKELTCPRVWGRSLVVERPPGVGRLKGAAQRFMSGALTWKLRCLPEPLAALAAPEDAGALGVRCGLGGRGVADPGRCRQAGSCTILPQTGGSLYAWCTTRV